jgi:hypothetical protein
MTAELLDKTRAGLEAWLSGDVDALAPMLDPEVELLWWSPGEWDCHGSDEVLSLLRERKSEGVETAEVELIDAGGEKIVASRVATSQDGPGAGLRPATLIIFRGDKVIKMRQFRYCEEALAAAR